MVSDNMYVWLGILAFNYIIFLHKGDFLKRLIGSLMLILLGIGGYMFISASLPWGLVIAFIGIIYLVITLVTI